MTALPSAVPQNVGWNVSPVARFPGLRALAWDGDLLYAARGYQLLRARIQDPSLISWHPLASFRPSLWRRFTVRNRLSARLFRDGFHGLATLSSGGLVAAVPRSILTLRTGETEFHATRTIIRGTRPLHITAVPNGTVFWGEYFDNSARDEVHIYASSDAGATWSVAYTFPKGSIRHVHNIVHDSYENCLWVLTGDYGDECRIVRASCDFSRIETVLQGNQQARAVALIVMKDGLFFSSDTPLEQNYIYRLSRRGELSRLAPISSSSIYGCRVGGHLFFSAMVEPSEVNTDRYIRLYGSSGQGDSLRPLLEWKKDRWPSLFQYGNAFLPDGNNMTRSLAVTTVAVEKDDMVMSLYNIVP